MIGRLRGAIAEKQPPHLVLDVNGVGYELEVPMTTLYRLPHVGEIVTLHTHLVVREDAHLLYGFYEKRERELFRELIRLNGVGPKLALALMSGLEVDELVRCVQAQDTSALTRIPGAARRLPNVCWSSSRIGSRPGRACQALLHWFPMVRITQNLWPRPSPMRSVR